MTGTGHGGRQSSAIASSTRPTCVTSRERSFDGNDLPIMTLAVEDRRDLPGRAAAAPDDGANPARHPRVAALERLRNRAAAQGGGGLGELRQAEAAFVERRVARDGLTARSTWRGSTSRKAVSRSAGRGPRSPRRSFDPPAPAWSVLWFTGLVNKQNGNFDEAIADNFKCDRRRRLRASPATRLRLLEGLPAAQRARADDLQRSKQQRGEGEARVGAASLLRRRRIDWFYRPALVARPRERHRPTTA